MSGMVSQPQRVNVNVPAPSRRKKRSKGPIKRHHWFHGIVMVCGWIVPPLAVLIRFGVGFDFLLNIILTICGYFPGHGHNFWIQNIRNNSNEKHSPKWAVRAGLVKDYNKSKLKKRGWAGRYDDDGMTAGGVSVHAQRRWEAQEEIVDPLTGETRRVARPQPAAGAAGHNAPRDRSRFPSPWSNDPLREGEEDEDDYYDDDDEGPEDAGRGNYAADGGARRTGSGGRPDNRQRDSVTGAILDDDEAGTNHRLQRSTSGRSLHDQYAERYNLGSNGSAKGASKSSISLRSKRSRSRLDASGDSGLPGAGDAGVRQSKNKKGFGGLFGGKKGKSAPEDADAGAYRRPYGGEVDDDMPSAGADSGYAPPGGAFGNDDALDRELQGVRGSSNSRSNGYANGNVPSNGGYNSSKQPQQPPRSMARDDSGPVAGDGLSHQF